MNTEGYDLGAGHPRRAHTLARRRRQGFTLLEMLMAATIITIISSLAMVNISSADASQRLDRAAEQIVAAVHYARMQAMSHSATVTGTTQVSDSYGVQIDTAANTLTVYHTTWNALTSRWSLPGTAVATGMFPGGTYVLNLATLNGCAGVKISGVSLTGTSDTVTNTATPYYCQYKPIGTAENYAAAGAAAITITYGGYTRSISIPEIGDPQEN